MHRVSIPNAGPPTSPSLRVRVLKSATCRGPAFARNRLLEAARCDFVHFHDVDDPLDPGFLARVKRSGFLAPGVVVISSFDRIRGDEIIHHTFEASMASTPFDLVFRRYVHLNAMILCRHLALASGGFDEALTLCEEKDFLLRLLAHGAKVRIIEDKLAEWVIRQTSFMDSQGWTGAAVMLRRFWARLH